MAHLDPNAQALLEVIRAAGLEPLHKLGVDEARERMRASLARSSPVQLASVESISLPSAGGALPMRLYRPGPGDLPVALFLHGGGWTLNDLDTHDHLCRLLAKRSGWLLVALDYRRAPEHKHPAALEDAHTAYEWLLEHAAQIGADTGTRAVVGESSGGSMAAALTLRLRDRGLPLPTYQVLAYPIVDVFDGQPSYTERGGGYVLDRAELRWYFDNYLPLGEAVDPYVFPLRAPDLSGLPPALVMTAEFDPLRDEGIAYARRLAEAGVAVEHRHAADQMHGFLLHGRVIAKANRLIDGVGDALRAHARDRPPASA